MLNSADQKDRAAADGPWFLELSTNALLILNQKTQIIAANRSAAELFCCARSELYEQLFIDLVQSSKRKLVLNLLDSLSQSQDVCLINPELVVDCVKLNGVSLSLRLRFEVKLFDGQVYFGMSIEQPHSLAYLAPHRQREDVPLLDQLDSLLRCMQDVYFKTDSQMYITHISPNVQSVLGYRPDEVLGRPISQFMVVDCGAQLLEHFNIEREQLSPPFESKLWHHKGYSVWVSICGNVIQQKQNEFQLEGTIKDISDQKQIEAALLKTNFEWQVALDSIEDSIYLLDLDDRVLTANQAFYDFTRLTPQQVIGEQITKIMHPNGEQSPCPVCKARRALKDTTFIMEPSNPFNGMGVPMEIRVRIVRDEQEQPLGIMMGIRDLSRLRKTEGELRHLHEHVSLLLDSTSESILGIDPFMRCTFANNSAISLLEFSIEELQGRDVHELLFHSKEDGTINSKSECVIYRAIVEQKSFEDDTRIVWRKDGISVPVHLSINPIIKNGRYDGAVIVFRNVAEQRAMARKMNYLAKHDNLTGLVNRYEFEDRLQQALTESMEFGKQNILCYLDLDQFKVINDTCGHVAGDTLLQQLSSVLQNIFDSQDTLARLGGDEFGVLIRHSALNLAMEKINAIRHAVDSFRFVWEGRIYTVGVSIGVCLLDEEIPNLATALSCADEACYIAKESGRNRVHVYHAEDEELMRRHGEMQWIARIQSALEHNHFQIAYQRIQPLNNRFGHLPIVEFLIRMVDQHGALICPASFIAAAERYNLIQQIDRWMVNHSLDWIVANPAVQTRVRFCSLNLSAYSISSDEFLKFLIQAIKTRTLDANKLCFEITETAAMSNLAKAVEFMNALTELGCHFSLDDFGSGMASFAYLKYLPVGFLKIDGCIVRDLANNTVDHAMVTAINQVAMTMEIATVAEFVENQETLQVLSDIGIDYAQGYGVAYPQALEQLLSQIE
ncbi:MAG: EAL domain-containing protein [Gammaproteobacteria bacterium]|nr:EAL domain-containing protein [Gammaproteobacteria bacterium]